MFIIKDLKLRTAFFVLCILTVLYSRAGCSVFSASVSGGYSGGPLLDLESSLDMLPGWMLPDFRYEYSWTAGSYNNSVYSLSVSRFNIGTSYLFPVSASRFRIGCGLFGGFEYAGINYNTGLLDSAYGFDIESLARADYSFNSNIFVRMDIGYNFDVTGLSFHISGTNLDTTCLLLDMELGFRM